MCCRFAEGLDKLAYGGPAGYAKETARCKAIDVAESLQQQKKRPALIVGADTVRFCIFTWSIGVQLKVKLGDNLS